MKKRKPRKQTQSKEKNINFFATAVQTATNTIKNNIETKI